MTSIMLLGLVGCVKQSSVLNNADNSASSNKDSQKNLIMDAIDFDNISQVVLNNEESVLKNANDLDALYKIFDNMDLQEKSQDDENDKEGFLRLILDYKDGKSKNVMMSANKIVSIDGLSYKIVNYEEISQAISKLFDKE